MGPAGARDVKEGERKKEKGERRKEKGESELNWYSELSMP